MTGERRIVGQILSFPRFPCSSASSSPALYDNDNKAKSTARNGDRLSSTMPTITFSMLPPELHLCISSHLTPAAICALRETCQFFHHFIDAHRELVWRNIAVESSYLDEQTAPCTGCRVGARYALPGAFQGKEGCAEALAAAIDAQRSGLGSFDDITTWTDFGI
jgi:hypothetical protein